RKLSVILLLLIPILIRAGNMDVKVYKGTSRYQSDVICTVRDGKVYDGTSVYLSDGLLVLGAIVGCEFGYAENGQWGQL
ncbi:MAG: hypothetical protein IK076_00205, partial [Bacteroidales bacterium]|nr:hypothetical protein [Bacteroidales bacterium]